SWKRAQLAQLSITPRVLDLLTNETGCTIPALIATLQIAPAPLLDSARATYVLRLMAELEYPDALMTHHRDKPLDVPSLLKKYGGHVRYVVAAPVFFPLTAYMIALNTHRLLHPDQSLAIDQGLQNLAITLLS